MGVSGGCRKSESDSGASEMFGMYSGYESPQGKSKYRKYRNIHIGAMSNFVRSRNFGNILGGYPLDSCIPRLSRKFRKPSGEV